MPNEHNESKESKKTKESNESKAKSIADSRLNEPGSAVCANCGHLQREHSGGQHMCVRCGDNCLAFQGSVDDAEKAESKTAEAATAVREGETITEYELPAEEKKSKKWY